MKNQIVALWVAVGLLVVLTIVLFDTLRGKMDQEKEGEFQYLEKIVAEKIVAQSFILVEDFREKSLIDIAGSWAVNEKGRPKLHMGKYGHSLSMVIAQEGPAIAIGNEKDTGAMISAFDNYSSAVIFAGDDQTKGIRLEADLGNTFPRMHIQDNRGYVWAYPDSKGRR